MSTIPKWAEEGEKLILRIKSHRNLKVWIQPIYEFEGETFYAVFMEGAQARTCLHDGRGQASAYTVEIAKRKALAMSKHAVYLARTTGRLTSFEVCPKCNYTQKVLVDPENGVLICSICQHPFFIPEPQSF